MLSACVAYPAASSTLLSIYSGAVCSGLPVCRRSCAPACQAPRAHAPATPQRAPQLLPPPQRAPRCALGAPRLKHFISKARHMLRGRHALPPFQLSSITASPCRLARAGMYTCLTQSLPHTHSAHAGEGRAAKCRTPTASCAPACQAPRAHAPAPQRSAPQLMPPPQRAPQCVLGAPGPVHYIRKADVKGMPAFAQTHHHKPYAAVACTAITLCVGACNDSLLKWKQQRKSHATHLLGVLRALMR